MADDATAAGTTENSARLWWIACGLSLSPAITNGLARFAYGLLVPAMREDLGWSYTEAGWVNTANAIGYLLGSLLALALVRRLGLVRLFVWGMGLTALALLLSATSRELWALSLWRVLAGIAGAPALIAGGALVSALFAADRTRNALAIALYFGGGGLGMLVSALALPPFLAWYGAAGWPLAWLMLGLAAAAGFAPSWLAARAAPLPAPGAPGAPVERLPLVAMGPAFLTYFLFGVGYLIYVTFLVAWMRAEGSGAGLVTASWGVMGGAVMLAPFVWRPVLARARGGLAMGLTSLAAGAGALLPLLVPAPAGVIASAALFGLSFSVVPGSVTAFGRRNLAPPLWGSSIALFTVVFAIGQIVGPVAAGALNDWAGGTGPSLAAAGLILLAGALVASLQRPLTADSVEDAGA